MIDSYKFCSSAIALLPLDGEIQLWYKSTSTHFSAEMSFQYQSALLFFLAKQHGLSQYFEEAQWL